MELIHEHSVRFEGNGGTLYRVRTCGQSRGDGTWEGWLEFHPIGGGSALRTGRETSQPNREAVAYWASGLEPIYFEGAYARAS